MYDGIRIEIKNIMTIIQVTPEEVLEHDVFPGEELHPRLNTIEARRFIGGLANGERSRFDALTNADGQPDAIKQEAYIVKQWTDREDIGSLAGHHSSRALQLLRHYVLKCFDDPETKPEHLNFYYPLVDTPNAKFIADLHWDQENRFRRGVGRILSKISDTPEASTQLPIIHRHEQIPSEHREVIVNAGRISLRNTVQVMDDDTALGSNYLLNVVRESK